MTENNLLASLSLADQLRIAAVNLAHTGAPRALVVACWRAAEALARQQPAPLASPPARLDKAGTGDDGNTVG